MRTLNRSIFLSLILTLPACAQNSPERVDSPEPINSPERLNSSEPDPAEHTNTAIQDSTEILIAQPPDGWSQVYSLNTQTTRLTDFVPINESAEQWKTKVSFESHQSLTAVDPITILMGELDQTRQNCEDISSFNLFSGMENNYPTSVRLTFCGENAHTNEGEVTMTKAIQGNRNLYIVKLLHRVPPFTSDDNGVTKQQIASWSNYFGEIRVCDKSNNQHPCVGPFEPNEKVNE